MRGQSNLYKDVSMKTKQSQHLPIIEAQSLTPGDKLYRRKHLVDHAGVYIGNGDVIHNIPGKSINVATLEEFSEGKIIRVTRSNLDPEGFSGQLEKVLTLSNQYSVLGFNCEHLMNLLITKKAHSPQLAAALGTGVLTGGVALSKGCSKKQSILLAGLGAFIGLTIANKARTSDGVVVV